MVICLEWGADLHMAQLMPLPLTVSCFSKIQIGFTLLVPAHPDCPGQRTVKRVCVCVCVCVTLTHSKGMRAVKLCTNQNPPVANWRCRQMQGDLYNGHWMETVFVVLLCKLSHSALVVSTSACSVRGPRFESHHGQLCLLRWLLWHAALGTGCALLQCLGQLSLASLWGC